MYFDQLLDFQVVILLFLHTLLFNVPYFTLWILNFFVTIWVSNSLDLDQARHVVPDLGPNCLQPGYQQTTKVAPIVGKELNTKQHVDTTLWLKPWLKFISIGSS